MKLYISLIILIFLFFSCKKENIKSSENKEVYKILSILYTKICREKMNFYAFPAPPPNPSISWDSIKKIMAEDKKIEKDTVRIVNALLKKNGRLIVAIDSVLDPPYTEDIKKVYLKECLDLGFDDIYKLFEKTKDTVNIDVSQIPINRYSYILPYMHYYNKMPREKYEKYNIVLSFSKISFNKEYTKAIIIMGAGFGKLNGFSTIYFLEKKKGNWFIKCEKGLTIS